MLNDAGCCRGRRAFRRSDMPTLMLLVVAIILLVGAAPRLTAGAWADRLHEPPADIRHLAGFGHDER